MKFTFTEETEEGQITVDYKISKGEKFRIIGRQVFGGERKENASPELFYSEEEANCWCNYLCENKVLPSSLKQVLRDELYISENR